MDREKKREAGKLGGAEWARRKKVHDELVGADALRVGHPLRTLKQIRRFLEQETAIFRAKGDTPRANAAAKLAGAARDLLPLSELQKENAELRALLLEKHPELRAQLGRPKKL